MLGGERVVESEGGRDSGLERKQGEAVSGQKETARVELATQTKDVERKKSEVECAFQLPTEALSRLEASLFRAEQLRALLLRRCENPHGHSKEEGEEKGVGKGERQKKTDCEAGSAATCTAGDGSADSGGVRLSAVLFTKQVATWEALQGRAKASSHPIHRERLLLQQHQLLRQFKRCLEGLLETQSVLEDKLASAESAQRETEKRLLLSERRLREQRELSTQQEDSLRAMQLRVAWLQQQRHHLQTAVDSLLRRLLAALLAPRPLKESAAETRAFPRSQEKPRVSEDFKGITFAQLRSRRMQSNCGLLRCSEGASKELQRLPFCLLFW